MGTRFGGAAGVVSIAAALLLALAVAMATWGGLDLATGTYTFIRPATEHVDEARILVQHGAVTDVWISEGDRERNSFGFTPQSPNTALEMGDDSAVTTAEGSTIRQCWFAGSDGEHCAEFGDIKTVTVDGGDVSGITGSGPQHLVRYWVEGAGEPFAICYDDPNANDEETCWTWTEATGSSGA